MIINQIQFCRERTILYNKIGKKLFFLFYFFYKIQFCKYNKNILYPFIF